MGGRYKSDVFLCGVCKKPKTSGQVSNKMFHGKLICNHCIKNKVNKMTVCMHCGKVSEEEYPSGWYAVGSIGGQFDTSECLAEYARSHNLSTNTQWVRWR